MQTRGSRHPTRVQGEPRVWAEIFEYLNPLDLRCLERTGRAFAAKIAEVGAWDEVLRRLWDGHVALAHFYIPRTMHGLRDRDNVFVFEGSENPVSRRHMWCESGRWFMRMVRAAVHLPCGAYLRIKPNVVEHSNKVLALSIYLVLSDCVYHSIDATIRKKQMEAVGLGTTIAHRSPHLCYGTPHYAGVHSSMYPKEGPVWSVEQLRKPSTRGYNRAVECCCRSCVDDEEPSI